MSSTECQKLPFPSLEWFQALQSKIKDDPEYRKLGTVDAAVGAKIEDKVFVITFEAFECSEVREGSTQELADLDFILEMPKPAWCEMVKNIKVHGAADFSHTLNSLDMLHEISTNATGDQLRADLFFRYNESFQYFFNASADLDTTF